MNRGQILTKAIAIAKRNGFDISNDFFTETPVETWLQEGQDLYFSLILSHDFAKTFFGDNTIIVEGYEDNSEFTDLVEYENPATLLLMNRKNLTIPSWQYHLIQMTLCEDPLLYLKDFIKDYEQAELN